MTDMRSPGPGTPATFDLWHSLWRASVYLMGTVGLLCTYVEWGVAGLVTGLVTTAVIAATCGASVWAGYERALGARVFKIAATAGVLMTAAAGLVTVLSSIGGGIVLLLVVSSPDLASMAVRHWKGPSAPAAPRAAQPPRVETVTASIVGPSQDLSSLDDAALCLAWRRSFLQLKASESPVESLFLVKQRERFLDELHRRAPQGLEAWWASGGRASGDPLPYLGERSGPNESESA